MSSGNWTVVWPTEPGEYWFYGWCYGSRESKPERRHVRARRLASGAISYVTDGHFIYKTGGGFGLWREIEVELPEQKLFHSCINSPGERRFVRIDKWDVNILSASNEEKHVSLTEFSFWGYNTPFGWLPSPGEIAPCLECGGLCTPDETVGKIKFAAKVCDCPILYQIEDEHEQDELKQELREDYGQEN